jgi:hypothetical protein
LIQRNIQTKRLNTKLDHKKLGLFKIKRIIGLVNYKLALPRTINIHLVFHISLLKLVLLRILPAPVTKIEPVNPNVKYEIEEILDHRKVRNYIKYLVKWTNCPHLENTWEIRITLKNLENLQNTKINILPKKIKGVIRNKSSNESRIVRIQKRTRRGEVRRGTCLVGGNSLLSLLFSLLFLLIFFLFAGFKLVELVKRI